MSLSPKISQIMKNLFERIQSLEDEMLKFAEELEETRRASSNIIRLGVVEEAKAKVVNVKTGKNFANNIPFFVFAAGRVSHYRRPSVGEQCILLNLGSGDNLNNAVALMGLPSNQFPCPSTDENIVMTDYGNGMTETYDLDAGSLTVNYPGGYNITADINHIGNAELTGNTNRTGDLINTGNIVSTGGFNHSGAFAVTPGSSGSMPSFSGGINITGGDVTVDGISVKFHIHLDAENRPTKKPQ
ncbi:phage baseplate assembly protein V [Methylophaga sp.]|uniref:phage baseplate assembly protein V n=1 Tax=Methylophaga sp. TaxID=2024840 RepID=UPI003A915F9D